MDEKNEEYIHIKKQEDILFKILKYFDIDWDEYKKGIITMTRNVIFIYRIVN